ncbi:MAG: Ig-like domain-containing protein [Microthrixaceae bacterium]
MAFVVGPSATSLPEAGAQGASTTIDTPDIDVNDLRIDFNGYPGGSYDFGEVIETSCCGGAGANLDAAMYLKLPNAVRAGQSFTYDWCIDSVSTSRSFGGYEHAIDSFTFDGSIYGGTAWATQFGTTTNNYNPDPCKTYTATAPATTGASVPFTVPGKSYTFRVGAGLAGSPVVGPNGPIGFNNASGTSPSYNATLNVFTAPVAVNDGPVGVAQNGSTSVNVLANDSMGTGARPGTNTAITITSPATKGTCLVSGSNVFYVHSGATGTDSCTYQWNQAETDDVAPSNGPVSATVSFSISGPPVAVDDVTSVSEDGPAVTFDPRVNDSDPESGPLTITGVNDAGTQGTVTFTGTSITYDPGTAFNYLQAGQSATTTFDYTIEDDANIPATAEVTVTINGVNDAPVAGPDTMTTGEDGPTVSIDPRGNDSDADLGDSFTVTAVDDSGTQGTVTFTGTSLSYTPSGYNSLADGDTATDTFTYTITDGFGGTDTATVTVTIVGENDGPTTVPDTGAVDEDGPAVTVSPLGNDSDPDIGDSLTLTGASVVSGTGTATVSGSDVVYDPDGTYNHLSVGDTATVRVDYTVEDDAGTEATGTITITVNGQNDNPTAVDDTATVGQNGPPVAIDVLTAGIDDSDPDQNDTLTVTAVGTASAGTATLSGNTVTYDPGIAFISLPAGATGTATFTYDISDGQGGTDTATVTVTVIGANDAPTPQDDTASVGEDGPAVTVSPLGNDTDPDTGDVVSIQSVAQPAGGTVTWGGGATFDYLPGPGFNSLAVGETGTDTFSYVAKDALGLTTTAMVTVTVTGVNDDPTPTDDTAATDEATPVAVTPLANDTDPDTSDTLSVSSVDTTGTLGGVSQAGNTLTYDPGTAFQYLSAGETATDTFTYTASDGNGGDVVATVTVTITGLNADPVAVDDAVTTTEDSPVEVAVLETGTDDSDPDTADVLTVSAVDSAGTQGTVTQDGNILTYDPGDAFQSLAVGESATDTFGYTIDDGNGGTDTATVTVTITGVNDAPTAVDDAAETDELTPVEVEVLTNDTDPDGSDVLSVSGTDEAGLLGSVSVSGNTVTYDPSGVWNQPDAVNPLYEGDTAEVTFDYTADDGQGGTDTATVTITVNGTMPLPPDDCPPAAGGLSLVEGAMEPGETVTVSGGGFLPGGTVTYYVCSTPIRIGDSAAEASGAVRGGGEIPADLAPGDHMLFALGLGTDGNPRLQTMEFTVDDETTTTSAGPTTTSAGGATTTTPEGATTTTPGGATATTSATTPTVAGATQAAGTGAAAGAAAAGSSGALATTGASVSLLWRLALGLILAGAAFGIVGRKRRGSVGD